MEALADSDADEQNDVLRTLSEREVSTSELVRRVLSQVQTEFAMWNVAHCRQAFTSFTASSTWQSCLHPDLRSPGLASMAATTNSSPDARPAVSEANSPSALVSQQVYSPDGAVIEISSVKLEVIRLTSSVEPHPPYESCSPLHRSVFKGDDSDNMDFIPYEDDHTFDHTSHTHHYESFSWQDAYDPDLQVIVLEAVYRLQIQYALTYDEIEDCNVLPLKLRSQPGISGLLSTVRRRDRLHWAGNSIPMSYTFPPPTGPEGSNFRNRLKTLNSFFCPNLNCVEPLCSVHGVPYYFPAHARISPITGYAQLSLTRCLWSRSLRCLTPWDEADLDTFKVISDISSSATSCDLAELCLKPCYEVFYYRMLLHSCNSDEAQPADTKNHRRTLRFNGTYRSRTVYTVCPGQFSFPLTQSFALATILATILALAVVLPTVHVSKTNRIVSATAGALQNAIADGKGVVAQGLNQGGVVTVHELQMHPMTLHVATLRSSAEIAKLELEVKKSSWGLGTFLAQAAKAGDLIAEYIGEIIYESTVESRGDLATHRNRCYVFGLNDTFSLDSTYAGNISRFIDHSDAERGRRVNSQARVRLVNGNNRIGIFAIRDMEAGSEILMDYGSEFFIK
ncbi:hypothetical protein J3R83DRAFT_4277 [Lanmaoa asiatica]|nr:hypothetical protein J3R83DRAFT_4277 [Lanmaoa asiatica]